MIELQNFESTKQRMRLLNSQETYQDVGGLVSMIAVNIGSIAHVGMVAPLRFKNGAVDLTSNIYSCIALRGSVSSAVFITDYPDNPIILNDPQKDSNALIDIDTVENHLTKVSMDLSISSFKELWEKEDDEYWNQYLK